jgi:uncharacterized protein (TIGR00255 family)
MAADKTFYLKSMTAYGRGTSSFRYGRFTIEIQSVNRRFLEMNISIPRLFMRYEIAIRKEIAAWVGRGMLTLSLSWHTEGSQPVRVLPNLPLARAMREAWGKLAPELGIQEALPAVVLAQEKDLFLHEEELADETLYQDAINAALKEALAALSAMKEREGAILAHDLKKRLVGLHQAIERIEILSKDGSEKYRQKLSKRLEELFSGAPENEERILREVAVYAERVDITEEIVRFRGHLEQFALLVEKPLENVVESRGKTLDFLLQELLREITTIGSKASDLAIAQQVVTVKSELDKLKEQVQNIE